MTPSPERRILRKLLQESLAHAHLQHSDWGPRLYLESWADLEPAELTVVQHLLEE